MNVWKRSLLSGALGVVVLLAAGCGNGSPTGEPDELVDPVPTVTPAALAPITDDFETDPGAYLAAIPPDDAECLVEAWGSERFEEISAGEDLAPGEDIALFACVAGKTLARTLIGEIVNRSGELSQDTLRCMAERVKASDLSEIANRFAEFPIDALLDEMTELSEVMEPSVEERAGIERLYERLDEASNLSIEAFVETVPIMFCMNSEERAASEVNNTDDPPVSMLECLYEGAGADGLDLIYNFDPYDDGTTEDVRRVAADCGYATLTPDPTPGPSTR
jgi:hypothetical protein